AIDACYGRQRGPQRVSDDDRRELFALMSSAEGVTELAATFDGRDVLQFVAEWGGDRLNAGDVATLADTWLISSEIVPLKPAQRDTRSGDVIRRGDGRTVAAVEGEALYTTRHMLAIEGQITGAYERARHAGVTPVPAEAVDRAPEQCATRRRPSPPGRGCHRHESWSLASDPGPVPGPPATPGTRRWVTWPSTAPGTDRSPSPRAPS
ncbi:MAG: hypothetical protein ABR540_19635, partial [Acidimicrobiales bacterium]